MGRIIRTFPFSHITELEDFSEVQEEPKLVIILGNGNRYEIRKNIEKIKEMILEDWKENGEIIINETDN